MYLLVILGIVVVFVLVEGAGMGFPMGWNTVFMDFPSLLLLLFIAVPILLASGMWKDFVNAFCLFFGKKAQAGMEEKKKAVEALDTARKALHEGGILAVLLQFASLCHIWKEFDAFKWQSNMVSLILPLVYAYMLGLLLLPIRGRLNKELIDYMHGGDEMDDKEQAA